MEPLSFWRRWLKESKYFLYLKGWPCILSSRHNIYKITGKDNFIRKTDPKHYLALKKRWFIFPTFSLPYSLVSDSFKVFFLPILFLPTWNSCTKISLKLFLEIVLACNEQLLDKSDPCSTCLLFWNKTDTKN